MAIAATLTLGNGLCGFAGIVVLSAHGPRDTAVAALMIFAAWVFDVFDGMAASRMGVVSAFGAVIDSLCDVVSFGVLPALIIVVSAPLAPIRVLAIAVAAAYLIAAIVRLGRYTVKAVSASRDTPRLWFEGLSSAAAAMSIGAVALWTTAQWPILVAGAATAGLMVSPLPYPDIVSFYVRRRWPLWTLAVPLIAAVFVGWRGVLVVVCGAYLLGGAAVAIVRR